jgi:hypothetical protein
MTGYEKRLGEEFGKTVPGVFTDEPNIVTSGGLRWTPDLFEAFRARWGYDLPPLLPCLEEETGDWKKVRHNYMELLLQLFIDRWAKPWYAYTESHGLLWTGHYWEHGWPQMNDGPDNMAMYAWHQVPAIDMLFNQFNEEAPQAQFGNIRAVKELRSAANQTGRKRTLSETYGAGGWEETFKDFKRLGDWEYVLGVNFMNQHLSHMTLAGARKYDHPPVFTSHSPWYGNYKALNDYFGRLSVAMSLGEQRNSILVLEPNATLWGYYSHTGSPEALMEIGRNFQAFVTRLEKSQMEYDLGSENIIKDHGRVDGGRFIIGQAAYPTVVIPPMCEILNSPTLVLLKEFVEQGGRLIAFSEPGRVDGAISPEPADLFAKATVVREEDISRETLRKLFPSDRFSMDVTNGNPYHQRRRYVDGELIFIVNSSMEEATTGQLSVAGETLLELDAESGEIYTYPATQTEDALKATFRIEPAGSLLLYSAHQKKTGYHGKPSGAENARQTLPATGEMTVTRGKENVMPIDFCDLAAGGETHRQLYFAEAADRAFRAHGFAGGNPWNTSVQYRRNIVDRDTFSGGGFTATYRFTVKGDFDRSGMRLAAERPELFRVAVNGEAVRPEPGAWWLDRSFGVYAVGKLLRAGENTVEMSVAPMRVLAEIEPVYILGDFSVLPEAKGWSIGAPADGLAPGSWKAQQHPFYSWDVTYGKSYDIAAKSGSYAVQLGQWNGTVAEVHINGEKAGIISYDPYRLNVTPYIREGNNRVEVTVIGSLANLLGPHYRNATPGLAAPGHWKNIHHPISAAEYRLMDYGLTEDFQLMN